GQHGRAPDSPEPEMAFTGEGHVENPQHQREGRGLWTGGQQRGDRRGRAFVDVGAVNVERSGDDLETEADEYQREAQNRERRHTARGDDELIERWLYLVNARGAGDAIHHGDAVEEKRSGERAQNKIFQRGFVG